MFWTGVGVGAFIGFALGVICMCLLMIARDDHGHGN